ncbi:MAG: hypothetical protein HW393_213, partial [Dehalococcoidia bacterium]|nr:hypothetical protein [Dehalococcoidia bacterium]
PSIIPELAPFSETLETVIHEWLHQYLVFYPLGSSYFGDEETRTLNETVANMAGRELAGFDFRTEMRALRLRVEELLADGRVEVAERLMDEKRAEFESKGVYIRRINQAYFAFHGSYADTPGSIDPIGPKLQSLRDRAGSAARFVRLVRGLSSEADLDRLLEKP